MKQGNQFYLDFQIEDENNEKLNINSVLKIQFVIGNIIKIYDGENNEVIYDKDNEVFKVWLTENETFNFEGRVKMEARVLFKGEENYRSICGTFIEENYWYNSVLKEDLDV